MPGYIIHLVEAKMIESLISFGQNRISEGSVRRELFGYGVLLPDAVEKMRKGNSHFWKEEDGGKIIRTPDLTLFLEKYGEKLSDPLLYGCLAHLHLDKLYFQDFFEKNVEFLNREGKTETQLSKVQSVYIKKSGLRVTPEQFFSEEYLYGDYTKMNHRMMEQYCLELPQYSEEFAIRSGNSFEEVNCRNLEKVLNKLAHFTEMGNESESTLQVFSYEELICFLEQAACRFVKGEFYQDAR